MSDLPELQQILVIDIETVPQHPSHDAMEEPLALLWEQKTRYQRRNGETPAEYYPWAGIWAEFGKIICISVGAFITVNGQQGLRIKSFYGHDEHSLLLEFSDLLNKQPQKAFLCAHNGKEFDFPYLCRRMLINQIPLPPQLQISGKKPWEIAHIDTMELWKFGDYKNYTSLALLAAIFNIPTPKDDISGEDVHRVYWEENDVQRISDYCAKDVVTTAQLFLRFKSLPAIPGALVSFVK